MITCLTLIYVKDDIKNIITELDYDTYNFNTLSGYATIGIRFMVNDTSLCFINCHLDENNKNKISNIGDIHKKLFRSDVVGKKKYNHLLTNNFNFLFGELSSSINLPRSKIMEYI